MNDLKILYAGNLAGNGYYHTKILRSQGINIELVMEKNPSVRSDPLRRDATLQKYPDWIKFYDMKKNSWKFSLLKTMRNNKYDLIHAHAEMPIFAFLSRKNFIAQTLGSDLSEMAFSNSLKGRLLRLAYKKAVLVIFTSPKDPKLLEKLNIEKTIFLPPIWDMSFFTPKNVQRDSYQDQFVIFHPSSHIWDVKGNDILLRGFSKFLKNFPNSILLCIDWGKDVEKSKELIKKLELENNVKFLNHLTSDELLYYYNMSDVVADQFIHHGIGGVGMESFCCSKPLIVSCHENAYKNLHSQPPPVNHATTENEITSKLEELTDRKKRDQFGKMGLNWFHHYLEPTKIAKQYVAVYNGVINKQPIEQIRKDVLKCKN